MWGGLPLVGVSAVNSRQRRVVSVGAVSGVLAQRSGRWVLDNDAEVRVLEALRGERGARERFWALAAALDAGVVEAWDLRRLNGRLSAIAATEQPEQLWRVRVPGELMGAVAYVCVCMNNETLSRWLGFALSARLEANLVRGLLPGPSWVSCHVSHQQRYLTWERDIHWISELPAGFWSRLAAHSDAQLRAEAAASDPAARPKVLQRLAEEHKSTPEVLDLVASNPQTPPRVLRRLCHMGSGGWVRPDLRAAQNRAVTAQMLGAMTRSGDWVLRYVAAWHPNAPASALRRLASDKSDQVRAAVAHAASTPTEVLEHLASDGYVWVRRNVASNTSTPIAVLEALLGDRLADVRAAAVTNKTTPVALAAGRVRDRSLKVRHRIAWRTGISPDVLAALGADPKEQVRRDVARNPRTPPEVLDQLAADPCVSVRGGVAYNPAASPGTLRLLAGDEDPWPRTSAVINRSTPPELLAQLATDPDPDMRRCVANNTAASAKLLTALAGDEDWYVRDGVASNPAAPTELLEVLAHDETAWVRRSVCGNDKTPRHLVDALRTDPDYEVRRAAQTPPNTAPRR